MAARGTPRGEPLFAAFTVDGLLLDVLTTAKYRRYRRVGERLASEAARRLAPVLPEGELVPVPLTPAKLRERGFNQSEDFARALARRSPRTVRTDRLVRRRGGRALAGRPREEREEAIRNAFAAEPLERDGTSILLVDDVVTTGSTTSEAARVLREAGARLRGVVAIGRAFRSREDRGTSAPEWLGRL